MSTIFRKIVMGVLATSLALAGLPLMSVYAAGPNDPPAPRGTPDPQLVSDRLELAFAHQTLILDRTGKLYDDADQGFTRLQNLLDKAKEHNLDVSQIESALDALKTALTNARPAYDQAKSLHDAHSGFDANGKVTDPSSARDTIKGVHDALSQFRTDMDGAGKALREAIKAFRQANPRPTPSPTSTGNS